MVIVTGLAALVWLALGLHLGLAARHALAIYRQAQGLRSAPLSVAAIDGTLPALRHDVAGLRRWGAPFLWGAECAGWLPWAGPGLQALSPLLGLTEASLDLTQLAWDESREALGPWLADEVGLSDALVGMASALAPHEEALAAHCARAQAEVARLQAIPVQRLPARLRPAAADLQAALPLLDAALSALPRLPGVVAQPGRQGFLLLAQNNDELRATGGYLSSIAEVTFEDGRLVGLSVRDGDQVENWSVPHDDPPEALRRHMEIDLWVTADGNWWPDFPRSARQVAELYERNQGTPIHGVVAMDVGGAVRILEALAPLSLPGGEVLEEGRVLEGLRESWSMPPEALRLPPQEITATRPFREVEVTLRFEGRTGQAWFDDVRLERAGAPGENLLANGSFEADADADSLPDAWQGQGLAAGDGLVANEAYDGERSLRLVGDEAGSKALTQRLALEGRAGETLRLSAWSQAAGVEYKGGPYDVTVRLLGEGEPEELSWRFAPFTHDWAAAGTEEVVAAWWSGRKGVIGEAVRAAATRVLSEPLSVRWPRLLETVRALLDERRIQVYMEHPDLQALAEARGWAGAPSATPGDYLLVVDSNLGYNKVTASVRQRLDYAVRLEGAEATARLTVTYENTSPPKPGECDKFHQYTPSYLEMTRGCYWDYVRVYVPAGARLVAASGGDEPVVEAEPEQGRTVFATYLLLEPGERRELVLEYALPGEIAADGYSLYVQKQAGTDALPLTVRLSGAGLPPAPALEGPGVVEATADAITYHTDLRVDRQFMVDTP